MTKFELTEEGMPASTTFYGAIAFAKEDENNKLSDGEHLGYWTNAEYKELDKPLPKYGESYPANVYDENSLLWTPVQNYKDYFINTLKKTPLDMRLITYDELVSLGCSADTGECTKDFLYEVTYFSMSAYDSTNIWYAGPYGGFGHGSEFWEDDIGGLRPVITISKTEI